MLTQRCEVALARASRPCLPLTRATAFSKRERISGGCSDTGVAHISSSEALERLDRALEAPELVDSASSSVLRIFVARACSANPRWSSASSLRTNALKSLELSAMRACAAGLRKVHAHCSAGNMAAAAT